ncbi:hypothetical protein [Peribacillus frigoritolerans]|uniref:hypothetical protein n=1 Tax=Peribacillus frigoritolerans TaxID=450367 RepID=UPI00105A677A|nr:hypothetical protein [Peribacillus frigoritolerans]TDL78642.1 hypothetical protein E2R53_14350 [Peribacillus frigoritolerans]
MRNNKWLIAFTALTLVIPTTAIANTETGQLSKPAAHEEMKKEWHERRAEREQKVLELVSKYSPETKQEWENVLKEREALIKQLDQTDLREKHHALREKKKQEIAELEEKVKKGEITKEQMREKLEAFREHKKEHKRGRQEMREQWTQAIESKDKVKIKELLHARLQHMKEHNQKMKTLIKEQG